MRGLRIRIQRGAIPVVVAALGLGCATGPRSIELESSVTADGLHRVRDTRRIGAAYLRPGANFAAYGSVLIEPVTLAYKPGAFELKPHDEERLKKIFQEAFARQLARSRVYAVVSEPGARTLRVSGNIVNLAVRVPQWRGGEANFVMDAGEMTLILEVRDSRTRAPLARIADRRLIRPNAASVVGGYESNPVNNWGAVREICNDWARILREGLDDLHALPVPPAPAPPAPG